MQAAKFAELLHDTEGQTAVAQGQVATLQVNLQTAEARIAALVDQLTDARKQIACVPPFQISCDVLPSPSPTFI